MQSIPRKRNAALQAHLSGITEDHLVTIKDVIHRHPDFTTIEQRAPQTPSGWARRYKGKVADLNISAPLSAPMVDAYLSINGLKGPWRNNANVSYLNSIFADVDFHTDPNPAVTTEDAIFRFMKRVISGVFPFPSIIIRSGRGFWLHFLLREDGSDRSVPNVFPALELWQRLQNHFAYLLTQNGFVPDPNRDEARLTRVPGSLNSDAGNTPAIYSVNYRESGPIMYTMPELARLMHLPAATAPTVSRFTAAPVSAQQQSLQPRTGVRVPNRRKGPLATAARRERHFWLVVGMRGGIIRESAPEGGRDDFAFCLNTILRGDPAREEKVIKFCRETCSPPMTAGAIRSLLKKRPHIFSDNRSRAGKPGIWERLGLGDVGGPMNTYPPEDVRDTAGRWNGLNPIEATRHGERTRLEIDRLRNPPTPRANRGHIAAQLQRRHNVTRLTLGYYMANGCKPTTLRQIASSIRGAGLKITRRTLRRDLMALGMGWSLVP